MPLTRQNANSVIEVNLSKVKRNIEKIRKHLGSGVEILYTAKSNGYGHGLIEPTFFMQRECGIKYFSTGIIAEAIKLRDAGFNGYLLVMGGVPDSAIPDFVSYGFVATIYDCDFVRKLAAEARRQKKSIRAHIKIETGLNRLGVKPGEELNSLLSTLKDCPEIQVEGMYTHLANSYSLDKSYTKFQLNQFEAAMNEVRMAGFNPSLIHAAASGGCISAPEAYYNMVRIAALIYGLDISPGEKNRLHLEPCIRWTSFVVNVRWIEPGESVSYYHWFVARRPTKVAVIGFGMGDGYVRTLAMRDTEHNADVIIRGKRAKLIDLNVDQAFVDATEIDDVQIGDTVTLLGRDADEEITTIELGAVGGTSSGHVCCSITERPFRDYVYE